MKQQVPIFTGECTDGKLVLTNRPAFMAHLKRLSGSVDVIVRKRRNIRSDAQRRYYWGVVIQLLSEHTGYEEEEMHDALRQKFLATHEDNPGLPSVKSTSELDTAEFSDYIEKVKRFAAIELGVIIPSPGEVEI